MTSSREAIWRLENTRKPFSRPHWGCFSLPNPIRWWAGTSCPLPKNPIPFLGFSGPWASALQALQLSPSLFFTVHTPSRWPIASPK